MNEIKKFEKDRIKRLKKNNEKSKIFKIANNFTSISSLNKYTYNFTWMGRPIIQFPQDMILMQELIWEIKPDFVIETGIAHGGSLIFSASILELIGKGKVIGVDIEIRKHNLSKIKKHKMSKRIKMIQSSSIDKKTISVLKKTIKENKIVLVFLDSNHTHDHVLEELNLYSQFVSKGSYIVVFDTTMNIFDNKTLKEISKNYRFKPYGRNNNPHSAVKEFLKNNKSFRIDKLMHQKALITNCYDGFLKKIK